MELKLSSPATDVPRVGPAKAKSLQKLGITHARDFLYLFPRRYNDFSNITTIDKLQPGKAATIRGRVRSQKQVWGFQGRRRLLRIFVEIEDETGVLDVTWFNLRFLGKQLWTSRELFVAGKVELNSSPKKPMVKRSIAKYRMRSPVLEFLDPQQVKASQPGTHTGRITPIYPETYGVTSRFLRYQVKTLLPLIEIIPEYLPDEIRRRNQLMGIKAAIKTVHFPPTSNSLEEAQRRLRFDELFFLQLSALVRRQLRRQQKAVKLPAAKNYATDFVKTLPYTLTNAQSIAMAEISRDLATHQPMNRLLQGDVGSGKSVVALYATKVALANKKSVLYLAPTELLARQQADSFKKYLGEQKVALLIGAQKASDKEFTKNRLASGEVMCVVGTHALLQGDLTVKNLALTIVDEQHRFGVTQRKTLLENSSDDTTPHLLSMTATPIPRTLNLTVYGDLEVSVINELPPGRKPIETVVVSPKDRDAAVIHILSELHAGRQGFVIAPLVEKSEKLQLKSAKETYLEMKKLFPDIAVGLLHGQLDSEEKAGVLNSFVAGAIQLLVATAVVEVGVDVPNASVMIIEGAEHFGLAQLHQFRGRIGRGTQQAYCYLFPTTEGDVDNRRLQIIAETTDGFKIAEEDLKLRGPGELYGIAQSGFGNLQVASLLDYDMIKLARREAEQLLKIDPKLEKYPILKGKVAQKNRAAHFE